jgi:hypothetical protein
MADTFSSKLGDVDANIDKRKQLVATLRAKLGGVETDGYEQIPPPIVKQEGPDFESGELELVPPLDSQAVHEPPDDPDDPGLDPIEYLSEFLYAHAQDVPSASTEAPKGDAFKEVFEQMDRGLDERQRIIDGLKFQLSQPLSANVASTFPGEPAVIDLEEETVEMPDSSNASNLMLPSPVVPQQTTPTSATLNGGLVPQQMGMLPPQGSDSEATLIPPPKRVRTELVDTSSTGHMLQSLPRPLQEQPQPVPQVSAGTTSAAMAEAAELAARKAAMLNRLSAVEALGQPEVPGAAGSAWPPGTNPATGSDTVAPNSSSEAGSPGSSPEEYEAYRRKCWQQYYEYTAVWKKYYDQNQAEQSGKGKAKGKLRPFGGGGMPPGLGMVAGKGSGGMPAPRSVPPPVSINPAAGLLSGKGGLPTSQALALPPGATGPPAMRPLSAAVPAGGVNRGLAPRHVAPLVR